MDKWLNESVGKSSVMIKEKAMKRRVAVTGLGAVTPIGNTVEEFWNGIREGRVGIGPITKFDASGYEVRIAAEVKGFVAKERLDQLSETGKHQGVVAYAAAYTYAEVEDILAAARSKNEAPFIFLLDNIEDPHNLGAIIRTANLAGAHGVIIPKNRAAGLTAAVARASAGALNYTPVARVTNLAQTMEALKKEGLWFVCADMGGTTMYQLDLTGPIGLVIGNEGDGVGRLVREKCDFVASIPMKGDIDSLNASVAAGVLAYEIVRQRMP